MVWFSVLDLHLARFRGDRHDPYSPPLGILQSVFRTSRSAAVNRYQGIAAVHHVSVPFHITGSRGPFMKYDSFICLLKDAIMPLLPLIWKPACLSFEGQDCDQLQLDLRILLSNPQQYLRRPQISPQCHSGIEATCAVLDLRSNRFFQSVQHPDTGRISLIPSPWQFLRSVSRKTAGSRFFHFPLRLPYIFLLDHANLSKNNPKVNRVRLGCDAFLCYPLPENN